MKVGVREIALVFIFGVFMGAVVAVVNTPKPQASTAPVVADWRNLKSVDDELIASCSESFDVVSQILDAQQIKNYTKVANLNVQLSKNADDAEKLADKRRAALDKLGY